MPSVTQSEVRYALSKMKNDKAPGPDGIMIEQLKSGGAIIHQELARLFTKCIETTNVPKSWKGSELILIHKKGDIKELKNYRPISLLCNIYKVFTKVITNRLQVQLDENQPVEQAGFRSGYSTADHIHTLNQLKEKCSEYQKPLCIALVDYEKAFDSVEVPSVMEALDKQGIESRYIELLKTIYKEGYTRTTLHKESRDIPINKGVRQGDTISPKLFTSCLEDIFRSLNWEDSGISINGKTLSNLRFADDIAVIANDIEELQRNLQELSVESSKRGLRINWTKTKMMRNAHTNNGRLMVDNHEIQEVQSYIYLGQRLSLQEKDMNQEISRRIQAGWLAYNNNKVVFGSNIPISLKRKVFNQCVLPAMTYASETWTTTKQMEDRLARSQRQMERKLLGLTWQDRKTNEWIRSKTKVVDILGTIKCKKLKWAGHIARMKDDRWTYQITNWRPRDGKRRQGRPSKRWRDELDSSFGSVTWNRQASDRSIWRVHAEAFVQQVD